MPIDTSLPAKVDTVGLSVPITDADERDATITVTRANTPEEQRLFRRKLPGGGFLAWGMGDTAWIEASLPKRVRGHNLEGLTVAETWEALADLHDEATRYVEVRTSGHERDPWVADVKGRAGTFEEATVKRLDVVRDFTDVRSAPWLLDGLANVQCAGRSRQRRYADGDRNRAETLSVGPKSAWLSTLYDKHTETLGQEWEAPEGSLRFEARMRSDVLSSVWAKNCGGAVVQVMDLDEERLQAYGRGMFERVGFHLEVEALGRLAEVVFGADLSAQEQRNLWAYMTARPMGADIGMHRNSERKYRRMAERLGVVVGDKATARASVRLDYDTGRELTVAA